MPKSYHQVGKKNRCSIYNQIYPFFHFKWFFLFFSMYMNFLNFLLHLWKYRFWKKIEAITVQLLVRLLRKFLCVIWNLVTKTYPKFVTIRSLLKIFQIFKKFWNEKKRIGHPIIYETIIFFCQVVNHFSALLLCKIYVFEIFNIVDFFYVFVTSQSAEILII